MAQNRLANEMTWDDACDAFDTGRPVCLTKRDQGATTWVYATIRRDVDGTLLLRGPHQNWYRLNLRNARETYGVEGELNMRQEQTFRLARLLHRLMTCDVLDTDVSLDSDGFLDDTMALLRCVSCQVCGDTLTRPNSIMRRMGDDCSGLTAEREANLQRKRAVAATFVERMAELNRKRGILPKHTRR